MNVREKGVTLVEVMIALSVLLIVFMGLIQASLLTTTVNVRNQVRDEGVRIAADTMTRLRQLNFGNDDLGNTGGSFAQPFTSAGICPPGCTKTATEVAQEATDLASPTRFFRNQPIKYTVTKKVDVDPLNVNKSVTVKVSWQYQGTTYSHTIMTTLR